MNLSAAPGEIIGIIGHNGAGKSTFSRTLCGLHTNCTGQILWDGKELNAKSRLKRSYMVMQDVSYQLFADTLEKECVFGIKHPDLDAANRQWNGWVFMSTVLIIPIHFPGAEAACSRGGQYGMP